ncbi:MAG: DUF1648 domain-containing protein [Firmicutes bacterium]|nr:DUF1648 domain-containing protein [Bacillota bacterium]
MSLVVYRDLPDQIAIHWDGSGNPDNFAPKALAAFGLPFLFVAINLFSKLNLFNDPRRAYTSPVMQMAIAWLPPLLSLVLVSLTLFIALGKAISITLVVPVLLGLLLIVVGNYLPKNRQNYTIGLKLPWTLDDPDNWNKTHRLAGYLYILAGLVLIGGAFLSRGFQKAFGFTPTVLVVIALVLAPRFYSLWLYKRTR